MGGWQAGTVSLDPSYPIGDESRRNYLGVYEDKVYIFTSDTEYTNTEVINLMQQIRPGIELIQLDGGASAQLHSEYGWMDSSYPLFDRQVPDVLAIYRAP